MSSSIAGKGTLSSQSGDAQSMYDDDDMFSLDFTVPSRLTQVEPVVVPSELSVAAPPPSEPSIAKASRSKPKAAPRSQIDPCVEQAARLYANGKTDEARELLESSIRDGNSIEMIWNMLLDLYRLSGEQGAFEKLALEYVSHFEKSPPSWSETQGAKTASKTMGRASVTLTGTLNAGSKVLFAQVLKTVAERPTVRIILSKLQDADDGGCILMLNALKAAKKIRHEIVFDSTEHLIGLLKNKIKDGKRENESVWLLLLELYQRTGQVQAFEDLALQYAIAFELSPPSWEMPKTKPDISVTFSPSSPVSEISDVPDTLQLTDEILQAIPGIAFMDIAEACAHASNQEVVIDVSELRRIDVASTFVLVDTLKPLSSEGKHISIRGASPLVAALFEVADMAQVAQVAIRRF